MTHALSPGSVREIRTPALAGIDTDPNWPDDDADVQPPTIYNALVEANYDPLTPLDGVESVPGDVHFWNGEEPPRWLHDA